MTDDQNAAVEAKMTEEEILQALASKDSMVVRQAAFEAANQGLKSALPLLVSLFESQSMGIIEAVEVAVRKIRGEEAVRLIIPVLRNEDATVRNIAMDILREIAEDDVQSMIDLVYDEDPDIRIFATDILGSIKNASVVQVLSEALIHDPEVNVRYQVAISLGEIKDPKCVEVLKQAIADEEWVQYAAIGALAKIRDTQSVDVLLQALDTVSPLVVSIIIEALGGISAVKAVPRLLEYLAKWDGPIRIKALKAIIQILGPNALSFLGAQQLTSFQEYMIEALKEKDEETLMVILSGLSSVGMDPAVTKAILDLGKRIDANVQLELLQKIIDTLKLIGYNEELENALSSDNDVVRRIAIETCGGLQGKGGRFVLKRHFEQMNSEDKKHAINLMATNSDEHDIPFFVNHLEHSQEPEVICAALRFLGVKQKHVESAPTMIKFLESEDQNIHDAALEACLALEDEETVLKITSYKDNERADLRKMAIYTMGYINAEFFFEDLAKAMDDSDSSVRKTAIEAIGYGLPESETKNKMLMFAMQDEDKEVRLNTVGIMSEQMNEELIPTLVTALSDTDDWVKMRALEVLGLYKIDSVVQTVIDMIPNSEKLVKLKIIETLALIGGDQAFQALLGLVDSDDSDIQHAAQVAMESITRELGENDE